MDDVLQKQNRARLPADCAGVQKGCHTLSHSAGLFKIRLQRAL
jgi:hypothetical protein